MVASKIGRPGSAACVLSLMGYTQIRVIMRCAVNDPEVGIYVARYCILVDHGTCSGTTPATVSRKDQCSYLEGVGHAVGTIDASLGQLVASGNQVQCGSMLK